MNPSSKTQLFLFTVAMINNTFVLSLALLLFKINMYSNKFSVVSIPYIICNKEMRYDFQ